MKKLLILVYTLLCHCSMLCAAPIDVVTARHTALEALKQKLPATRSHGELHLLQQTPHTYLFGTTDGAFALVAANDHLPSLIASLGDVPVYGTFLDGENMYGKTLTDHGLIVMGNEGNGIGEEVACLVNERLYIPNYPPQRETSESLNVAVATAVICAEFRRRTVSAG